MDPALLAEVVVGAAILLWAFWPNVSQLLGGAKNAVLPSAGDVKTSSRDYDEQLAFRATQTIKHSLAQNGVTDADCKALLDPILGRLLNYSEAAPKPGPTATLAALVQK